MAPRYSSPDPIHRVTVQHLDTQEVVSWADGIYQGDPSLVQLTQATVEAAVPVRIGTTILEVSDTAEGVAAAALAACCGRGVITSASFPDLPQEAQDEAPAAGTDEVETITVV